MIDSVVLLFRWPATANRNKEDKRENSINKTSSEKKKKKKKLNDSTFKAEIQEQNKLVTIVHKFLHHCAARVGNA